MIRKSVYAILGAVLLLICFIFLAISEFCGMISDECSRCLLWLERVFGLSEEEL